MQGKNTMNISLLRPMCVVALTLLVGTVMLIPVTTAQSRSPRADELLRESLRAMKHSLHQVHTVGYNSVAVGNRIYPLHMTADCIMQPHSLRGHFRVWGTRVAQQVGARPEAYDKQFILFLSSPASDLPQGKSWERNDLKGHQWRRSDVAGNIEAFQFIDLCVPLWIDVLQTILPKSLTNLGLTHTDGHTTWHLRSTRSSGTGRASKPIFSA